MADTMTKLVNFGVLCFLYTCITLTTCSEVYLDLFEMSDTNNDTFLTKSECRQLWLIFDSDKNAVISKTEFELRWTFLGLDHYEHAPLFFEQLDKNYNKEVDAKEINRVCFYFDNDGDGFVSKIEYDLNWRGLFTV